MADVDTLRELRAQAAALVSRLDALLDGTDEDAVLRRGRTPAAIVAVVARKGSAGPSEIAEELRCAGREVSDDAVAQGCLRLARAGKLRKTGRGVYALPAGGRS